MICFEYPYIILQYRAIPVCLSNIPKYLRVFEPYFLLIHWNILCHFSVGNMSWHSSVVLCGDFLLPFLNEVFWCVRLQHLTCITFYQTGATYYFPSLKLAAFFASEKMNGWKLEYWYYIYIHSLGYFGLFSGVNSLAVSFREEPRNLRWRILQEYSFLSPGGYRLVPWGANFRVLGEVDLLPSFRPTFSRPLPCNEQQKKHLKIPMVGRGFDCFLLG